jgi:beta-xylosidase
MQRLLFAGDYPDPSIVRVENRYYITHSSFLYHPGLLIFETTDPADPSAWRPLAFAVDQPGWDIWAPELIHHQKRFFLYYFAKATTGDRRGTNWVVTAESASGPWSEPREIPCTSIDPGHVVDEAGRRFLHFSGGRAAPLSPDGLSLAEEPRVVYKGWQYPKSYRVEGSFLEGPKLLYREPWYYLLSAQGGTAGPATSHMAIAARGKSPLGPWENAPANPFIHTDSRREQWWSTGHATLFDTLNGEWHAVYHGYRAGYHTLGRQTLIAPVRWQDQWPVAERHAARPPAGATAAAGPAEHESAAGPTDAGAADPTTREAGAAGEPRVVAPMRLSDDFESDTLAFQWRRFDTMDRSRIEVGGGELRLSCAGTREAPSLPLVCTPAHPAYAVEVEVDRSRLGSGSCAGILLYYDERCFAGVLLNADGSVVVAREGQITGRKLSTGLPERCTLIVINDHQEVELHVRVGGTPRKLDAGLDISGYNHNVFGRFLSLRVGLMAVGEGRAGFRRFRYTPI